MYGAGPTAGGGAMLASTGLAAGSWVLAVVGVVFIILGVWVLVKRHSNNRP